MNVQSHRLNLRPRANNPAMTFAFWLLAVMTLCNLNGAIALTIGFSWPVTLGLVYFCSVLCVTAPFPLRLTLGSPGVLVILALTSYLLIGLSVATLNDYAWYLVNLKLPFSVVLSLLIVTATAGGAFVVLQRIGVDLLLKGLLTILVVACAFVMATPLLNKYVFSLDLLPNLEYLGRIADRFSGFYQSPNSAGEVGCYTVVLSLALLTARRYKMLAYLGLLLGVGVVVSSVSRAAMLISALTVLIFLWWSWTKVSSGKRNLFAILPGVAVVVVVGVLVLTNLEIYRLSEENLDRLRWFGTLGELGPTGDQRELLWESGWGEIEKSPLVGHGIARFHALNRMLLCIGTGQYLPCDVHNAYLMLWGEAGIIPLVLLLFGLGYLLWKSLTLRRCAATAAIGGSTFVFMGSCMVATDTPFQNWHNFMLGVVVALTAYMILEASGRQPRRKTMWRPVPAAGMPKTNDSGRQPDNQRPSD